MINFSARRDKGVGERRSDFFEARIAAQSVSVHLQIGLRTATNLRHGTFLPLALEWNLYTSNHSVCGRRSPEQLRRVAGHHQRPVLVRSIEEKLLRRNCLADARRA